MLGSSGVGAGVRGCRDPRRRGWGRFPRAPGPVAGASRGGAEQAGGGRLLWRREEAVGMQAEVGVDSGPAVRARFWRSRSLSVPPDSATRANSHCTKIGARVKFWPRERASWRGESLEASGPGTRRTCQALPRFPFGSWTPGVTRRPGCGWIWGPPGAGFVPLSLGLPRSPDWNCQRAWAGLAGLRCCSAPPGSPPLLLLKPRDLVKSEHLPHTLLKRRASPSLALPAVGLVGYPEAELVPGNILSYWLEKGTRSSP